MKRIVPVALLTLAFLSPLRADDMKVTDIQALCQNGQTFVTWKDVAEGEAGKDFQYSLYRSDKPISADNLDAAELVISGIHNNSAVHYGYNEFLTKRLDPKSPMSTITEGGQPLPRWSGLAVYTAAEEGHAYYAVVATDADGKAVTKIVPGESATVKPVEEKVAPIQPIKTGDSKERGRYANVVKVTGQKNLPMTVSLHASSSGGGPGSDHGDYYLYWGRLEWGYRAGLPWQFDVQERDYGKEAGRRLTLSARETMANFRGTTSMETYWFGYYCTPQWADHKEPRAYNFTERRMLWTIDWVIDKYSVDPERVYAGGGSMGAWGSSTFAFRHPEVFAAVYPNRPRTRQRGLPGFGYPKKGEEPMMFDGKTPYYERMDMTRFATEHPGDLPFLGWCCGRRDGFATFKEQIDMVKAMTASHHGFAFAWNDGDHSSGSQPMGLVTKYYPPQKFARNQSYPAFGNSSIDGNMGTGELVEKEIDGKKRSVLADGDLDGGINLGFDWKDVVDEETTWSAAISNELCKEPMTVDVTPRRCQKFKAKAGEQFNWSNSAGGQGKVTADANGLVTVEKLVIKPGQASTLKIWK